MKRVAAVLLIVGSLVALVAGKIDRDEYLERRRGDDYRGYTRNPEGHRINQDSDCPAGMQFSDRPHLCEFTCLENGVDVQCKSLNEPGCVCPFEKYYNTKTKACTYVECENLDCIGRPNEAFYHCESGSRESCLCSNFITLDCRTGCQCKNGFCREANKCVPRKCKGSPFS